LAFPFCLIVCNYSFYLRRTVRGGSVTPGAEGCLAEIAPDWRGRWDYPLPGARALWYIKPHTGFRKRIAFGRSPTVASVEERVIDIVSENLGVNKEQVTRQTSFQEDLGADSLDIVEMVMELEEEFEITIPDDQAEKIKTVGEAIDYIEREQAKK
jgi:acyl carrier protein